MDVMTGMFFCTDVLVSVCIYWFYWKIIIHLLVSLPCILKLLGCVVSDIRCILKFFVNRHVAAYLEEKKMPNTVVYGTLIFINLVPIYTHRHKHTRTQFPSGRFPNQLITRETEVKWRMC